MSTQLVLTERERDWLAEILESQRGELLHGIHHADLRDAKEKLRERLALTETLLDRLYSSSER